MSEISDLVVVELVNVLVSGGNESFCKTLVDRGCNVIEFNALNLPIFGIELSEIHHFVKVDEGITNGGQILANYFDGTRNVLELAKNNKIPLYLYIDRNSIISSPNTLITQTQIHIDGMNIAEKLAIEYFKNDDVKVLIHTT